MGLSRRDSAHRRGAAIGVNFVGEFEEPVPLLERLLELVLELCRLGLPSLGSFLGASENFPLLCQLVGHTSGQTALPQQTLHPNLQELAPLPKGGALRVPTAKLSLLLPGLSSNFFLQEFGSAVELMQPSFGILELCLLVLEVLLQPLAALLPCLPAFLDCQQFPYMLCLLISQFLLQFTFPLITALFEGADVCICLSLNEVAAFLPLLRNGDGAAQFLPLAVELRLPLLTGSQGRVAATLCTWASESSSGANEASFRPERSFGTTACAQRAIRPASQGPRCGRGRSGGVAAAAATLLVMVMLMLMLMIATSRRHWC
mmetsp:Transcript_92592/g.193571  ORF Transcript_92592/g.193571 Transcript_92592/m.193571 type:complete len:317 (-) Transcript_92592:292-1242(-)